MISRLTFFRKKQKQLAKDKLTVSLLSFLRGNQLWRMTSLTQAFYPNDNVTKVRTHRKALLF